MSPNARALNRSVFWAALMLSLCLTVGIMAAVIAVKDDRPWWASIFFSLESVGMFMSAIWWAFNLGRSVLGRWFNNFAESKL